MNSILGDLYRNELSLWEHPSPDDPEYRELEDKAFNEEEYFKSKLSLEDGKRIDDYRHLLMTISTVDETYAFSYGFKMGTLLMTEVFLDPPR